MPFFTNPPDVKYTLPVISPMLSIVSGEISMISAIAGPNNPKAPSNIAGNVKTFQPNNITHIQKNHEIPRARAKNFQGFAFEILVLILFNSFIHYPFKGGVEFSYNGFGVKEIRQGRIWTKRRAVFYTALFTVPRTRFYTSST